MFESSVKRWRNQRLYLCQQAEKSEFICQITQPLSIGAKVHMLRISGNRQTWQSPEHTLQKTTNRLKSHGFQK